MNTQARVIFIICCVWLLSGSDRKEKKMKKKTYPVQRGSPRVKKVVQDLPLTGQGKVASGGTYSAYGYPDQKTIMNATQEYLESLERMGLLEPALEKVRAKEKVSVAAETQNEISRKISSKL